MKSRRIIYLERILRFMARAVLRRHQPKIVGVTGSVGKTSAKEAIYCVLASKYNVRKTEKNYNNEIGIPLTIIGFERKEGSYLNFLAIFLRWLWVMVISRHYPEILVLEMGVDRPGDMRYLLSFISPLAGVVTNISSSHLEYFRDLDHIAKEKGRVLENLPEGGIAILNADDSRTFSMAEKIKGAKITFGLSEKADVYSSGISLLSERGEPGGLSFKLNYQGKSIPVRLPHVIADHLVYAALVGVAAGIYFKINLVEIAEALENFKPLPGRMNLLGGIKKSWLIDDTYNASPSSVVSALEMLGKLPAKRKIAVLGDMLELGSQEKSGHLEVADKIFRMGVSCFLGTGKRMNWTAEHLKELGFSQNCLYHFDDPVAAGKKLQFLIQPGDLVLIKGSQGMRMEKVVEEVMAEPQRAGELLCRQSLEWVKKPFNKP